MSRTNQIPLLHISNLDKAFPLSAAPPCLRCKEITTREEVLGNGPNHGRWRYNCQSCIKRYGRVKGTPSFCTWDDDFGIDVRNPLCRCDAPSREGHCGYGSLAPGKIFMTCAVGKCAYELWPGIYVDVIGEKAQALLSCTCSTLPATFQAASGGTVAILYDDYCLLHGVLVQTPQTPKREIRKVMEPLTPRITPRHNGAAERGEHLQVSPTKSRKEIGNISMANLQLESPLGKRNVRPDALGEDGDGTREGSPSKRSNRGPVGKYQK
jgi:hypothetical protein